MTSVSSLGQVPILFSQASQFVKTPVGTAVVCVGTAAAALLATTSWSSQALTSRKAVSSKEAKELNDIKEKVSKTYMYVVAGLATNLAAGMASHAVGFSFRVLTASPLMSLGLGLTILAAGWMTIRTPIQTESTKKHLFWFSFNAGLGVYTSFIHFIPKEVLLVAGGITLGLTTAFSLIAKAAPDQAFLNWKGPLALVSSTITITSLTALFFPASSFALFAHDLSLYGGLALSCGVLIYYTQKLVEDAKNKTISFDPINKSLKLNFTIFDIFLRTALIIWKQQNSNQKSNRKV